MKPQFEEKEIRYLKLMLEKTLLFEKENLKPGHHSLAERGYIKFVPAYTGPLKMIDEEIIGTALTEAGRIVVSNYDSFTT